MSTDLKGKSAKTRREKKDNKQAKALEIKKCHHPAERTGGHRHTKQPKKDVKTHSADEIYTIRPYLDKYIYLRSSWSPEVVLGCHHCLLLLHGGLALYSVLS